MCTREVLVLPVVVTFAFGSGAVFGAGPNLGKPIAPADFAEWDINVEPSGAGLPPGSGAPDQGAPISAEQCSAYHGEGGKGATTTTSGAPAAPPVISDVKLNGIDDTTVTIANYWPYIRRSMSFSSPRSVTDDQFYALTAYIRAESLDRLEANHKPAGAAKSADAQPRRVHSTLPGKDAT
jgi:S-disulfanyl-L-cysteine oxidoreductase SoxD